jgi:tryptophan-rich sensory protein
VVGEIFGKAAKTAGHLSVAYDFQELVILLSHTFFIGTFLCFVTYFSNRHLLRNPKGPSLEKINLILGTVNILYLCMGLSCVMILVNNNLARAFAIGAAIALVRFRIKLGKSSSNSNILFGIVCGIACGLNELSLAWLSAGAYFFITILVRIITGSIQKKILKKSEEGPS